MIWNRRGTKEFVIIMDESTQVADISPQCRIQRLKDVIFTFDSHSSLAREPLFLDGGFHSWLWHYPSLALKSELPQVQYVSDFVICLHVKFFISIVQHALLMQILYPPSLCTLYIMLFISIYILVTNSSCPTKTGDIHNTGLTH